MSLCNKTYTVENPNPGCSKCRNSGRGCFSCRYITKINPESIDPTPLSEIKEDPHISPKEIEFFLKPSVPLKGPGCSKCREEGCWTCFLRDATLERAIEDAKKPEDLDRMLKGLEKQRANILGKLAALKGRDS